MTAVEAMINEFQKELEVSTQIGNEDKIRMIKHLINIAGQYLPKEKLQHNETWDIAHQAGRFEGKGIAEENWQTFETHWEETFKS
jgi:hypothetical protein